MTCPHHHPFTKPLKCSRAAALIIQHVSCSEAMFRLMRNNEPARYARRVPAECPESVRDLIAACMDADPAERPSAREIVEVLTSGDGKGLKQQRHPPRKRSTPEVRPRCSQSACQLRRARQSFAGPLLMVHAPGLALFWCVLVRKPIRFCVEFV